MLLIAPLFVCFLSLAENILQQKINYCDKKLCPYQGTHVGCNKTKAFSADCEGIPKVENMIPYINLILHDHNYYRNLVASGEVKCFYPAARMPLLKWDWDLADTADYNVRSCIFGHDHCRSTMNFPLAGQNIYMAKTTRLNVTISVFITEAIFLWFEEQFDADHELLMSFHKTMPQTGHFTMLVNDRQNRVGCAFLNNLHPPLKRFVIFTCNYSSTNVRNKPTYKPGKPASLCRKRNLKFKALCEDPIDPNDINWYI